MRLGDALVPVPNSRAEKVKPTETYRLLGVRLDGAGAFPRETKLGAESSAPTLYRVRTGDFIYSRLFAWRGAFAIIPEALDGCYVSNEFPLFNARENIIDLRFLNYWFRSKDVLDRVEADYTGSTPLTRNRYKESFFLNLTLLLPPLEEQRRIVARVEGLMAKVEEARGLRDLVKKQTDASLRQQFGILIENATSTRLGDIAPVERRVVELDGTVRYREIGARSFGRGLFHKPAFDASEATWQKPVWIHEGDVVLSNIKAWEGAISVAEHEHDGSIASHRYITLRPKPEIESHFLSFYLLTPEGLEQVGNASPGSADRNRTTSLKKLSEIAVPLPSLEKQKEFVKNIRIRQHLEQLQVQSQLELDALPSSILARAFAGEL